MFSVTETLIRLSFSCLKIFRKLHYRLTGQSKKEEEKEGKGTKYNV
jgi:hypothetical protein